MAHTCRLSARQGLPLLTLLIAGAASFFVNAQAQETVPENAGDNTETAPIVIDMAAPLEPERAPPPPPEPSALGVYRNYIQSMETSGGAFASGLTEQLLGLGLNLQALDRHAEAAAVLKRGGNGNPHQPMQMKPQFYSFTQRDACHPSGEAAKPCALMWLGEDAVAVGYYSGEVVAWAKAAPVARV